MLSELMPHKRIDVAVRAFTDMGLPLLVIGDGPDARRLKKLAGPTVRFAGRATDADVARMLASARALVVTATEEFGIAAVEAQAAGRPVIALRHGGVVETLVEGRTGVFFDPVHARGAGGDRAFLRRPGDRPRRVRRERAPLCPGELQARSGGRRRAGARLQGRARRAPAAASSRARPRQRRVKRAVGASALLLAAGGLSAFTITRGYQPHDEGLMLAWAQRIAAGEWPYRDFWINYGPGQPLLLAGLVKLFGPSLIWWRVLRVALDAVIALEAFVLVRRSGGRGWALAAWAAVAAAMAWPSGPGPNPAVLALALAALLLAPSAPLGAGLMAGAAVWFRLDLGLAAVLAVVLATRSPRALLGAVAVAVVGLVPFVVVAGGDMVDQTVGFALHDQGLQRLAFPWRFHGGPDPNKLLEFYLPAILMAGSALWAIWALWRRRGSRGLP